MKKHLTLAAVAALALTACGSGGSTTGADGRVEVVTSFYPLQFAIEQVGGEHVTVTNLTKAGAEPHDVELSPRDVLTVSKADAVVYLKGFQPSVDDAVAEADSPFDVSEAARLDVAATDDGHDHGEETGSAAGAKDPHFWLDPMRYADVADAVAAELGRVDPANAADYEAGAKDLRGRLTDLDERFTTGLKSCEDTDLVTGHAAFAYLAEAYDLHQESITLSPEQEPSAAEMADAVAHIKEHGVSTVYAETLVPRDVADTIAREAGATVRVLDPIEGITDESAAQDYFGIMDANLATLQKGQVCS